MMNEDGNSKLVNLMTPEAGVRVLERDHSIYIHLVKIHDIFQIFISTVGHISDKLIVKEASNKSVKIMTLSTGSYAKVWQMFIY